MTIYSFEALVEAAQSEEFIRFLRADLYPQLAKEAARCGWFPVEACALLLCHAINDTSAEDEDLTQEFIRSGKLKDGFVRQVLLEDANRCLREQARCELVDLDEDKTHA